MARTKEMKLHHAVRVINGRNQNIECFYDTHIRLWTAYVRDAGGNSGACTYAVTKQEAIDNCVNDNTD
jgi:hypothetical protein